MYVVQDFPQLYSLLYFYLFVCLLKCELKLVLYRVVFCFCCFATPVCCCYIFNHLISIHFRLFVFPLLCLTFFLLICIHNYATTNGRGIDLVNCGCFFFHLFAFFLFFCAFRYAFCSVRTLIGCQFAFPDVCMVFILYIITNLPRQQPPEVLRHSPVHRHRHHFFPSFSLSLATVHLPEIGCMLPNGRTMELIRKHTNTPTYRAISYRLNQV